MVELAVRLYNNILKKKIETFDPLIKQKFGAIEPSWPDNPTIKEEYVRLKTEIMSPVLIFEVGVGSGCVSVSTALACPNAEVIGIDISKEALKVAVANATQYKVKNLHLTVGDLLADVKDDAPAPDIMMANLPYVDRAWEWQSPEIEYEPAVALYAEKNGLELIYKLIRQIRKNGPSCLRKKPCIKNI